jgi:hypothetical protein
MVVGVEVEHTRGRNDLPPFISVGDPALGLLVAPNSTSAAARIVPAESSTAFRGGNSCAGQMERIWQGHLGLAVIGHPVVPINIGSGGAAIVNGADVGVTGLGCGQGKAVAKTQEGGHKCRGGLRDFTM